MIMDGGMSGSIPYTIRESRRARRVSLRITFRGELEVVVPRRFDRRRIPALVAGKRKWIERTSERLREERGLIGPRCFDILPAKVELPALGESWAVDYAYSGPKGVRLEEMPPEFEGETGHILISGDIGDAEPCKEALRRWVRQRAQQRLGPMLRDASEETGLAFTGVGFRRAVTRWASCSGKKGISLNPKLVFLPWQLVRYVFLHELAHTARLDHSQRFWAFLARLEPECRLMDRQVRKAWKLVPLWMDG
jgi:predicted metal-dependent hydrolase